MFKLVVLLSVAALAAAKPGLVAPLAYSAIPATSSVSQYSTSVVHGSPVVAPAVYSAGVIPAVVPAYAQAPHSPAVVLDAVHGVPLDTPEVVAARAAHYQAKALSAHHLGKRSVVAPVAYSSVYGPVAHSYVSPLAYSSYSAPLVSAYSAPVVAPQLAYSAVVPKAYSVHPW